MVLTVIQCSLLSVHVHTILARQTVRVAITVAVNVVKNKGTSVYSVVIWNSVETSRGYLVLPILLLNKNG